jgi:hypothetical protein
MSYRIIREAGGEHRSFILDEACGKIIAEVTSVDGCKPLVELANRGAAEAAAAVQKAKEAVEGGT